VIRRPSRLATLFTANPTSPRHNCGHFLISPKSFFSVRYDHPVGLGSGRHGSWIAALGPNVHRLLGGSRLQSNGKFADSGLQCLSCGPWPHRRLCEPTKMHQAVGGRPRNCAGRRTTAPDLTMVQVCLDLSCLHPCTKAPGANKQFFDTNECLRLGPGRAAAREALPFGLNAGEGIEILQGTTPGPRLMNCIFVLPEQNAAGNLASSAAFMRNCDKRRAVNR
jgi:hypothetical protein